MADPNTIRILEFDGGGARGYLSLAFLKQFVQLWGVDPATLASKFDVICGTSVGGLMALALAFGKSLDEITPFFTEQGPYIFSLGSTTGLPPVPPFSPLPSIRPNFIQKGALILTDTPFYASSGYYANDYGSGLLASSLQQTFGSSTLQNLRTNVIIPTYKVDTSTYALCSNLNYPDFVGQNELISNVALATASAPVYLPSLQLSNTAPRTLSGEYIDGGVYENNPSSLGRTIAQMLKPTANRCCILSIGTGIGEKGFDPGNPDVADALVDSMINHFKSSSSQLKAFDTIQTIFSLFNIASTGGQESVAKALALESSYTLDQVFCYRFQPKLNLLLNTELDNNDSEIHAYYDTVNTDVFNKDIDNIRTFLGHLTI